MSVFRNWGDWINTSTPKRDKRDEEVLKTFSPTYHFTIGLGQGFLDPPPDHLSWTQLRMVGVVNVRWGSKIENVMTNLAFKACHDLRENVAKVYKRNSNFNLQRRQFGEIIRIISGKVLELQTNDRHPLDVFENVETAPHASKLCYLMEVVLDHFIDLLYEDPVDAVFPSCLPKITELHETGVLKQYYLSLNCMQP